MTDRPSVFQTVQIGVETSGSAAANKKLTSMSFEFAPKAEIEEFRPAGMKFPTLTALGKEWTTGKVTGKLTYTEIIYALAGLINGASGSPIVESGSPVRWTFESDSDGPDTPKTFSVEQGDSNFAHQVVGTAFNGLEMTFNRDECALEGDVYGKALTNGITMTGSPTEIALKPVLPTHINVYLDDAHGSLGGTQLTRALEVGFALDDRFAQLWTLNRSESSYAASLENAPKGRVKMTLEADTVGMGLLTTMRAGSTKFMRIQGQGELIGGATYYLLQVDAALQVVDVKELKDVDGVFAIEFEFAIVHSSAWGKAFSIQAINTLTAL